MPASFSRFNAASNVLEILRPRSASKSGNLARRRGESRQCHRGLNTHQGFFIVDARVEASITASISAGLAGARLRIASLRSSRLPESTLRIQSPVQCSMTRFRQVPPGPKDCACAGDERKPNCACWFEAFDTSSLPKPQLMDDRESKRSRNSRTKSVLIEPDAYCNVSMRHQTGHCKGDPPGWCGHDSPVTRASCRAHSALE